MSLYCVGEETEAKGSEAEHQRRSPVLHSHPWAPGWSWAATWPSGVLSGVCQVLGKVLDNVSSCHPHM